jgi:hypothetical protein
MPMNNRDNASDPELLAILERMTNLVDFEGIRPGINERSILGDTPIHFVACGVM